MSRSRTRGRDRDRDVAPERLVRQRREAIDTVMVEFYREQHGNGGVSAGTRHELASQLRAYRRLLFNHRHHGALQKSWEDRNLDWIQEIAGETRAVQDPQQSWGGQVDATYEERPLILEVPAWRFEELAEELDAVANALGFLEEPDDAEITEEWTYDDLPIDWEEEWQKFEDVDEVEVPDEFSSQSSEETTTSD